MTAKLEAEGRGKAHRHLPPEGLGLLAASATGARPSPSSTARSAIRSASGIPVPEDQLPVRLPEIDVQAVLTGKGEPPLAKVPSFVNTTCPKCGGPARARGGDDGHLRRLLLVLRALPVAALRRGAVRSEARPSAGCRWTSTWAAPSTPSMHLLYFRFWTRVMKQLGLTPVDEPVTRLVTQGIVNGPDGRKMSKRWGNVGGARLHREEATARTPRAPTCSSPARPSATSTGPTTRWRAPSASSSACGRWPPAPGRRGRDARRAPTRARRWRSAAPRTSASSAWARPSSGSPSTPPSPASWST